MNGLKDVSDLNGTDKINSEVCVKLTELGCCGMCSLRYYGETSAEYFRDFHKSIVDKKYSTQVLSETENPLKRPANNACVACLGMLQPPMCDKVIDKIVEAVSKEDYDNPTFNVAFTLPVSFYLRAHALLVLLADSYPDHIRTHLPLGLVTVGVKDAWKYVFTDQLAKRINKTFSNESDLKIQINIQYEDDHAEIECLLDMYPNKFNEQKIKAKKLRHLKGPTLLYSRKTVETVLTLEDRDRFARYYPVPPVVPTHAAVCNNVLFEHNCIYVAGRYNKLVRGLPQTAWLVQDQRKLETSVHELIGESVQAVTRAQGNKLIASGREDVDVRMLGSGRPFVVELMGPRHVMLSDQEIQELEIRINTHGAGRIAVHNLKIVPKSSLELLKKGEELKRKTYVAYCAARSLDRARLEEVAKKAPVTLQQKTPVRVLHRRPIATRAKVVHWMEVSDIKHSQENDTTYFKLTLNTQAGTYIKEFIHGDFGRTKPSLGDILGGVPADCLALDVQSIELDWPPA
ncbi:putative tRNA pseudouridine synthase Pus10 [Homalodisca vitripennis]|nr:putative tRNA pseudouridine synthase Pus10 [Homalodisca vitripennis]